MSKNFSHAECAHASTKVARAKCRRDRANLFNDALTSITAESAIISNPITEAADALVNGPKMIEMGPKGRDTLRKRAARIAAKK